MYALLLHYAAYSCNSFADVWGQPIGPIFKGQEIQENFLTLEDGTDGLSRNVSKELQLYAA